MKARTKALLELQPSLVSMDPYVVKMLVAETKKKDGMIEEEDEEEENE